MGLSSVQALVLVRLVRLCYARFAFVSAISDERFFKRAEIVVVLYRVAGVEII